MGLGIDARPAGGELDAEEGARAAAATKLLALHTVELQSCHFAAIGVAGRQVGLHAAELVSPS